MEDIISKNNDGIAGIKRKSLEVVKRYKILDNRKDKTAQKNRVKVKMALQAKEKSNINNYTKWFISYKVNI